MRPSGRALNQLRPISLETNVNKHAEGSCLAKFGDTHVLCTASVEDRVPGWLRDAGHGWVTAEYGMLPRATHTRGSREAAKGKLKGRVLEDVGFEQMTLENWLQKYPEGKVLQYDQKFVRPYTFIAKLHNFEATKPAWHMQETPDLIVGVEIAGVAKGYDWEQLKSAGLVVDEVGDTPLVLATDPALCLFD